MKRCRIFLLLFACFLTLPLLCWGQKKDEADGVVVVVHKTVITQREVIARAAPRIARIDLTLPSAEQRRQRNLFNEQAIQELKAEALLAAESQRLLEASDTLKKKLDDLLRQELEADRRAAGGEIAFRESLQKEGTTYTDYMEDLRRRMRQEIVLTHYGVNNIVVSPNEMLDYYERNRQAPPIHLPDRATYRQIYIPKRNYATPEEALNKAQSLVEGLRNGDDFAEIAREHSRENEEVVKNGGLRKEVPRATRLPQIDEALFTAPIGEVLDPIETEAAFVILKIEERLDAKTLSFEETYDLLEAALWKEKYNAKYYQLIVRLGNAYHIKYQKK